jgi:transposase-like protein
MEVAEHQLGVVVCCGRYHSGSFPSEVSQPVQYGSRIKALSVLLNNDYKLPLEKIEQLMGDLWGCSFNESTALTANAGMYQALEPIEAQIKSAILASDVAHFDETGMRVEKSLHWFHVASTSCFTLYQFMLDLYRDSRKATVILADRQTWEREFKYICQLADCEEPPPKQGKRGKPKNTRGRNLLNRLTAHQDGWLAFAFTENVPFSNNQAERDIRCLKTKQKVATKFQTIKGAKHYASIQFFTSTFHKHSMNVFRHLIDILNRKNIVFQAG